MLLNMKKQITKKDILKLLNKDFEDISINQNIFRILEFKQCTLINDEPEELCVEVRSKFPSYVSIIRDLYNSDKYGCVRSDDFLGVSDFSIVPHIKAIVKQLEKDGYLYVEKQKCSYYTDFVINVECDKDSCNEVYFNAENLFTQEEKSYLESAIFLCTKGRNWKDYFINKILSEPVGSISLLISSISLIAMFLQIYLR